MRRIAGIVWEDPQAAALTDAMSAAQRPMGSTQVRQASPDGRTTLGCSGPAPRIFASGPVCVALDGDVYNAAELGPGSDEEAIATLYLRKGFEAALAALNGDFAVALYDSQRRELWLGRDRFGVRPLYYSRDGDRLAFASRLRALWAVPWSRREVRRSYVARVAGSHYRTFDVERDQSPFADIAQLPAGHVLRLADGRVRVSPYWRLDPMPEFAEPEAELAGRYRDILLDAVRVRLARARKPAFTLSGGMDSSSVLSCAVSIAGAKQHAYSTVYDDPTFDESREIQSMLDAAVARWRPVLVGDPDLETLVGKLVELHDEPVATATWLSHYLLCQAASKEGFGGIFGGLGGDELNAGEYEYFFFHFADLAAAGRQEELRHETRRWIAHHDHPVFRKSEAVMRDALKRCADLSIPGRCLADRSRIERYAAALDPAYFSLRDVEPPLDVVFDSYLKNRACHDLFRETLPCCLRAEDRQTAAFGLGHFLPFLDHRLVEFMFRVPGRLKIRDGVTKRLLREAMRGLLPEETRNRVKKTGWNAPAHAWFSGKGRDLLLDVARSRSFRERGIYRVPEVLRLIDEHEAIVASGKPAENHMMFLWQMLNLELWMRSLDRIPVPPP